MYKRKYWLAKYVVVLWIIFFMGSGCSQRPDNVLPTRAVKAEAVSLPVATMTIVPTWTPVPTAEPTTIAVRAGVPGQLVAQVQTLINQQPGFMWRGGSEGDIILGVNVGQPIATWIYAVVAPFTELADEVAAADLRASWEGRGERPLLLSPNSAAAISRLWGEPSEQVQIVDANELVATAWAQRAVWVIMPFDQVTPDMKLLVVDGVDLLRPEERLDEYPLQLTIGILSGQGGGGQAVSKFMSYWPGRVTNRDPRAFTEVAMTGVTALTRATAWTMERKGIAYPAEEVGEVLQAADVTHISNEVSFNPACPAPNPAGGTSFCSADEYFELLQLVGTDVVELTGNHVNDYGAEHLTHSIELYERAGMVYFGGGRNQIDSAEAAVVTHNGNRIAFVGCNPVGPRYAWATAEAAGSQPCSGDYLENYIQELAAEGYVVIATIQYWEHYSYGPTPQQVVDFKALAAAGAAAVSGSQGHHAQGFAFHEGAFIHYGLGNLFFDQMQMLGTRQTFVDRYIIYDGRLLNVRLWTGLIEDYARPRVMSREERTDFLRTVFAYTDWEP
ncbi:MAG TPA: CapA family protein [Anaerolineae bacterium]|nr:CapA family protein [Anaerolineae bacterium]